MVDRCVRCVALGVLGLVMLFALATPTHADGPPILFLPTPRGETWEIVQGYNCGTHDSWGQLSFDFVSHKGRTQGAPVYAAADGTMFWSGGNNTIILHHGDGYYTMYSHMQTYMRAGRGTFVAKGTQIGTVGAVNPTPTIPHLHFTFFKADGAYANNRRPLPLSFADGYDFPNTGRCNEHGGKLVVATGTVNDTEAPSVTWAGASERTWVNAGRVEWTIADPAGVAGFSQAWGKDPQGDKPHFAGANAGYLELTEPGQHTAYVRAWDNAGNQALATREIWYDPTPPVLPSTTTGSVNHDPVVHSAVESLTLDWSPASDTLSGVKGYQVYLGVDPNGTSEWFVPGNLVGVAPLEPGSYYLRARAEDNAGNFSAWATLETFTVR